MSMAITQPAASALGAFMGRNATAFPDPFNDQSTQAMPRTMPDALRWAQSIHMIDGTYSAAMQRVASYFITDVVIKPIAHGDEKISRADKEKFGQFLKKKLKIKRETHRAGNDYLCYGNSITSVLVPFRRYLSCPRCGHEAPLGKVYNTPEYHFEWTSFDFHAECPQCKYKGRFDHVDRRGDAESAIKIKHWNPHEIEILNDPLRDESAYIWKIPEYYRRHIREGKLFHLERAPWEVIQAIKHGNHLMFDPGVIYHMRDPALAGLELGGWGLARAVVHFRQAWYNQTLRRYNEAIVEDYIIPFRVITPEPKAGADPASSDPVLGSSLGRFAGHVHSMLRRRRRDPAAWNVLPFPIQYQALGGEANELAPFQLIDQANQQLLNAAGVPADLYAGTLSIQAAPVALRLFESHWAHYVDALNGFIEFVVDRVATILNWEPVDAQLEEVTIADDLNAIISRLQLMMGRQISQQSGLQPLGLDFETEQDQLLEEEQYVAERQAELAQRQQEQQGALAMQQQPQGQVAGGDPAQAGMQRPGQPSQAEPPGGPDEMMAKATDIAKQIAGMPDTQRQSEMIRLKKLDPTLHALVKSQLDGFRQQAQTAGGAQVMAQTFGQQPQPQQKAAAVLPFSATRAIRVFRARRAG